MKKTMKAAVCGLALVASLGLGMIAEAGRIPSHMVPLQTYAIKKVTCYLSPGGIAKGWIDPWDYVIVTQIRNDGWAYGSYPTPSGRVSKWFRIDDLVNKPNFTNQNRMSPSYKVVVYKNYYNSETIGSVWGNEDILVVSDLGTARQVIYKVNSGGYKMGWLPYYDCLEKPAPVPVINTASAVTNRMQNLSQNVNGYKNNTKYTGSGQCYGFAAKVYTTLFNTSAPNGYSSNNYYLTSYNGSFITGRLYDFAANNAAGIKSLFINKKPGSFIQMGRRYSLNSSRTAANPHSAILYSVQDNGCWWYEANADNSNTIKVTFYTWSQIADRNRGITIYEPNQYKLK